jgi:hypothetical protein
MKCLINVQKNGVLQNLRNYFPMSSNFPQKNESNDSIFEVADTLLVCVYTDSKKANIKY